MRSASEIAKLIHNPLDEGGYSRQDLQSDDNFQSRSGLESRFLLEGIGEVEAVLNDSCLRWHCNASNYAALERSISTCWGLTAPEIPAEILLSDIYAVELAGGGPVHDSKAVAATYHGLGHNSKLYCFVVHFVEKSRKRHSVWVPRTLVFGHQDAKTCHLWFQRIHNFIKLDGKRPNNLLVFINPRSGKGRAVKTWEAVHSFFDHAKVMTKVVRTEKAGHAFDIMKDITNEELNSFDGVITVGGDGFFNEVLNGLLLWRHKAPYPPTPAEVQYYVEKDAGGPIYENTNDFKQEHGVQPVQAAEEHTELDSLPLSHDKDSHPLLDISVASRTGASYSNSHHSLQSQFNLSEAMANADSYVNPSLARDRAQGSCIEEDATTLFSLPNPSFRFGIIPAGSTDAIVISTTGVRDPITSAMQIILGKRISLDVAQVVSWKSSCDSPEESPNVRYVASFAGYGFYGDVIKESESYRWMGPARYDYAGTRVFMRHRSYDAEVTFIEVVDKSTSDVTRSVRAGSQNKVVENKKEEKCHVNCDICADGINSKALVYSDGSEVSSHINPQLPRWLKVKGLFLSVGAAVMSCRNDKSPDGVVANAHLADGFLHLVLIRDCSRASYLRHLLQLTRKGGAPLDFKFVEHHKTSAFTFVSHGEESIWNVDGELFSAHQLSAQVFRGLISLFATGPEV